MSVRMVSWCVVSSSVKKASCVCTFVRPHTLLLFPYPPSCIDIPRSLAWSTENLNRRRLFLHVGHRCGAKSCGLARMFAVGSLFTVFCFFFVSIFSVVASSNFSPQLLFSLGWALGLTRLSEVKGIYGNDALEAADAEDKQWNQTEISEGLLLSLWFPRCHFLILFPAERGVTDVHPRLVIKQKCQPKISIIKTLTARSRGCFQH